MIKNKTRCHNRGNCKQKQILKENINVLASGTCQKQIQVITNKKGN